MDLFGGGGPGHAAGGRELAAVQPGMPCLHSFMLDGIIGCIHMGQSRAYWPETRAGYALCSVGSARCSWALFQIPALRTEGLVFRSMNQPY